MSALDRPRPHLTGAEGQAALRAFMQRPRLLAFDLDGTLAPIRPRGEDVQVPLAVARRLHELAARRPVAIVTGRAVADAAPRLGFTPTWIVGNHGAEDPADPALGERAEQALDELRAHLHAQAAALDAAGVRLEDKRQSIALHYRTAPDPARARAVIGEVLRTDLPSLHVFGGKRVVNLVAAWAPDKGQALMRLVERAGVDAALFVGDDVNDEAAFALAPDGWITVRVGSASRVSKARFRLDSPHEIARALDLMIACA